jgi:polysaccharide pyruvyl transferase WcaK-like protein
MKSSVALADYRSYRDDVSKRFMEGIGFDTSEDPVYPDIAFALPAPHTAERPDAAGTLIVGLGVMNYHGWEGKGDGGDDIYAVYLEKIAAFALWLLQEGHVVRLLTGAKGDKPTVADLLERLRAKADSASLDRLIYEPISTLQDVMTQIAATDLVVATRFHNIVSALKLGRPSISIGYAEKNDALMADMGLGDFCQHIERLSLDRLMRQFTELAEDRDGYAAGIRAVQDDYRRQLQHQDSILTHKLEGEEPAAKVDAHA